MGGDMFEIPWNFAVKKQENDYSGIDLSDNHCTCGVSDTFGKIN